MERQVFEKYDRNHVTDAMLEEAAKLFSEHYGTWGEHAAQMLGKYAKAGQFPYISIVNDRQREVGSRVRLSKDRLRAQCLPDSAPCTYVRVIVNGHLAGNSFACRWKCDGKLVCWVTQLVVDRRYRHRGLAVGLLNQLREVDIDIYGLMSSHPAACLAAAKAFGGSIAKVRLDFIGKHASAVIRDSPVGYVKEAKLYGSAFDSDDSSGLVSSVDTGFFVDHVEPLEALAWVQDELSWPLGELSDGHEFFLIIEARRRARSRPLSTSKPTT